MFVEVLKRTCQSADSREIGDGRRDPRQNDLRTSMNLELELVQCELAIAKNVILTGYLRPEPMAYLTCSQKHRIPTSSLPQSDFVECRGQYNPGRRHFVTCFSSSSWIPKSFQY
ncbi:hypothetical protein EVAR_54429_1 [Eumeta japonica]|uniref:Uncharacterized protein n=1 Tax=Eumeta variegata TaxID=151549 RepID=A0A4C1YZV7_EUMVA|nr:hypothetical protein EVAR_54429_1 [Eumeta japonica]